MTTALRILACALLAAMLVAPISSAQNLSGKWRLEDSGAGQIVDVVDSAGTVSMMIDIGGGFELLFSGTLVNSTLSLTSSDSICLGCSLNATTLPGNDYFDGQLVLPPALSVRRNLYSRCECFDGNSVDGDGCDVKCRIEPCFTCTGTPSICSPTPDGGACSDASICTTGDTCTAGACNGSPVAPCVDMSGTWDIAATFPGFGDFDVVLQIEQRENVVLFRNPVTGTPDSFGLIDPSTGDFDLATPASSPICVGSSSSRVGTVALDGLSYTATGHTAGGGGFICSGFSFTESATRQTPVQAFAFSRFGSVALALSLATIAVFGLRRIYA